MPRKANAAAKSFLNLSKLVSWASALSFGARRTFMKAWAVPRIWESENDQRCSAIHCQSVQKTESPFSACLYAINSWGDAPS